MTSRAGHWLAAMTVAMLGLAGVSFVSAGDHAVGAVLLAFAGLRGALAVRDYRKTDAT